MTERYIRSRVLKPLLRRFTHKEIAEFVGVSRGYMSAVVRGQRKVSERLKFHLLEMWHRSKQAKLRPQRRKNNLSKVKMVVGRTDRSLSLVVEQLNLPYDTDDVLHKINLALDQHRKVYPAIGRTYKRASIWLEYVFKDGTHQFVSSIVQPLPWLDNRVHLPEPGFIRYARYALELYRDDYLERYTEAEPLYAILGIKYFKDNSTSGSKGVSKMKKVKE